MTASIDAKAPSNRTIFALAWPMTLKAIFLHGTVVIDGYLVSSLGEESLAAMGLAAAVAGLVLGVILAFSNAMQIRAAQAFGTGDQVFLKSVLLSGLGLSAGIGVLGLALVSLFGADLLAQFAATPAIASKAQSYLMVFSLVILGESIGQCLSSFFNGCGQTRVPLFGYVLSVPINVISSIAFIHGLWGLPALGVTGAALGSAIAIAAQTTYFLIQFLGRHGRLVRIPGWRQGSYLKSLQRHIVFSLPIAATFISAIFASQVCSLIYAKMSLYAFAALTLIAPWNMIIGQLSMQWSQATGILVAQLLGKHTPESTLDRFLSAAWRGVFITSTIMSFCFILLTVSVDWLYADLTEQTRSILYGFLPILLAMTFLRSSNAICGNTLRASGDTVYVMHIFIWSQWAFRVPATAILVLYFQASAFWVLSLLLWEEVVKFPAFHRRLFKGAWKTAEIRD